MLPKCKRNPKLQILAPTAVTNQVSKFWPKFSSTILSGLLDEYKAKTIQMLMIHGVKRVLTNCKAWKYQMYS